MKVDCFEIGHFSAYFMDLLSKCAHIEISLSDLYASDVDDLSEYRYRNGKLHKRIKQKTK